MHDADGELEAAGEVCADACGPGIEFPLGSPSSREEGGVGPRAAESRRRGAEGAKAGGGGGAGILDQEGQFWLSDAMRHKFRTTGRNYLRTMLQPFGAFALTAR